MVRVYVRLACHGPLHELDRESAVFFLILLARCLGLMHGTHEACKAAGFVVPLSRLRFLQKMCPLERTYACPRACFLLSSCSCCVLRDAVRRHVRFELEARRPFGGMASRPARPFPGPPCPPRHPPPPWIAATAERFQQAREPPSAAAATAARWTAAAGAYTRGGAVEERVPGTENMSEAAQLAARELVTLRQTLAVSAASFEPPRHTMIIEGRPLQVVAFATCVQKSRPLRFFLFSFVWCGCMNEVWSLQPAVMCMITRPLLGFGRALVAVSCGGGSCCRRRAFRRHAPPSCACIRTRAVPTGVRCGDSATQTKAHVNMTYVLGHREA